MFGKGAAFIQAHVFDEYRFLPNEQQTSSSQEPVVSECKFEVQLNTLIECLNIFGTAGVGATALAKQKSRGWKHSDEDSDEPEDGERRRPVKNKGRGINHFFLSDKATGMRMSYNGLGYPLTLSM